MNDNMPGSDPNSSIEPAPSPQVPQQQSVQFPNDQAIRMEVPLQNQPNDIQSVSQQSQTLPTFNPALKQKSSFLPKLILVFFVLAILSIGGYLAYAKFFESRSSVSTSSETQATAKPGFKIVTGCVQPLDTNIEINFQLSIPEKYTDDPYPGSEVSSGYGCGNTVYYEIPYTIPNEPTVIDMTVAEGQVRLPGEKPNEGVWFQVPVPNNKYYVSIHRTIAETTEVGGSVISLPGVSDEDWTEIQKSFSFK